MTTELWKPVFGFDGYEVSNRGSVRSVDRISMQLRHGKMCEVCFQGKIIQPSTDKRGYKHVSLWCNNKPIGFTVHRLVAATFLREIGDDEEINHLDCDKQNNAIENLEVTTPAGNILHATQSGRFAKKLTDAMVREIRLSNLWGENDRALSGRFGVSSTAIRVVTAGKFWKRIDLSEWLLGHE